MSPMQTRRDHPLAAPDPILASWKVSEVLRRYPDLVSAFLDLSPAFRPLQNPIGRRTQARLVTVAQAARIAGLDPAAVVSALNSAAGLTMPADEPAAPATSTATAPAWLDQAPVAAELDVRPLLARGEEPFAAIMQAARNTPAGAIFRLVAPFEPFPLYDVLARKGFAAWARPLSPDAWEISFLREDHPTAPDSDSDSDSEQPSLGELEWDAPTATVTIDVSDLVPPEPMIKILEAVERLPPGGTLLVHHVRRPVHLYPA